MSPEVFQLLDNETIGKPITKRDFFKNYHQQALNSNDSDQKIEFLLGENNIYHRIGNAYLQNEMTIENDRSLAADRVFIDGDVFRLVNSDFVFCFKEARLSAAGASVLEHNKNCGEVSTIPGALASKGGDILSYFEKIDESQAGINNTSLKQLLVSEHGIVANEAKIKVHLPLENIFGFCPTFERISEQLGFNLTFKTIDL